MEEEPTPSAPQATDASASEFLRLKEQDGRIIARAKLCAVIFVLLLAYATLILLARDYIYLIV